VNTDVIQNTFSVSADSTYTLRRNVPAIQVLAAEEGDRSRLGLLTQLPEGAEVHLGGPGFDDQTIRVRSGTGTYYVFIEDLEAQRKPAVRAVVAAG